MYYTDYVGPVLMAVLFGTLQALGSASHRRRSIRPYAVLTMPETPQAVLQKGDVRPTAFDPNSADLPPFKSAEHYRIDVTERNALSYMKAAYLLLKRHGQDPSNNISNTCRDTPAWYPYVMSASNADEFDDKARAMLMRLCYAYIKEVAHNFPGTDPKALQASFLSRVLASCDTLRLHSSWESSNDRYKHVKINDQTMELSMSNGISLINSANQRTGDYYRDKLQKLDLKKLIKRTVPTVRVPLEMTIFGAELV